MGLTFEDFCSQEFDVALKKVCDFDHPIADKAKYFRLRDKIETEKKLFQDLVKDINDKYKEKFDAESSDIEKMRINQEAIDKQQELLKQPSELVVSLDYNEAAKTKANGNDLFALKAILTNIPVVPEDNK